MNKEEIKIVEYNMMEYKGVRFKVTPEFLQDAYHQSIPEEMVFEHIKSLYNKHISVIRDNKINQILGIASDAI